MSVARSRSPWLIGIFFGCTATPGESLVIDVTPPRTAASSAQSATQNKDEAFEKCKALLVKSEGQPTTAEASEIGIVCSEFYSEAACRDAWAKGFGPDTHPSERIAIVMEGCRLGYCDDLPEAAACSDAWASWGLLERAGAWASFREQILTREIGAERVRELAELALRARGAQQEGAGGPSAKVTVTIDAAGAATLDGVKVEASTLAEKFRGLLARDPKARLEIILEPSAPPELTRKLMDEATAAGFTHVSISRKQ